jgi:hypothetical protein
MRKGVKVDVEPKNKRFGTTFSKVVKKLKSKINIKNNYTITTRYVQ